MFNCSASHKILGYQLNIGLSVIYDTWHPTFVVHHKQFTYTENVNSV